MLPSEVINRIRVLSERGMGSKAIAKSTGISRNTVRKYLSHFQTPKKLNNRPAKSFCIFNPRNDWPESWEFPSEPSKIATVRHPMLLFVPNQTRTGRHGGAVDCLVNFSL